jgi:hypothetical protein
LNTRKSKWEATIIMKKRDSALVLALCFQLGGCFACDPPEGFECTQNSDCEGGGHVCIEAECYEVCTLQIHCDAGMFCSQDGLCVVEEAGGEGPVINSVSGNDPSDATRVIDGLVVRGEHLANAAFEVRGDKGQFGLSIRTASEQRVEAAFPPNILDGRYTLVAVNGAGEDQTYVQLELPSLTPEDLVERINGSSEELSTSVLPVGTTSDHVAAGDHDHAGEYAPASHGHAGVYSEISHSHDSTYSPIDHNHDGEYVPTPGQWTAPAMLGVGFIPYPPEDGGNQFFQPIQYRMQGDVVCLRGLVRSPEAIADAAVVFVLPVGYRPPLSLVFASGVEAGQRVDVYANGRVLVMRASGSKIVSFDGICFSVSE